MPESNTLLIQRAIDAWNDRDEAAFGAIAREDVEYVNPPTAVEPGTRTGHEGLRSVLRAQWDGLGPTARVRIDRVHDRGDVVVTEASITQQMPGSSAVIDNRIVLRWTFEAGQLRRLEALGTGPGFDAGRAAAGIAD